MEKAAGSGEGWGRAGSSSIAAGCVTTALQCWCHQWGWPLQGGCGKAAILRPQLWPAETASSRKWAVLCKDGCKNYSSPQLSDFLWCSRRNHNQDHKSFCRTATFLTEQITVQLHFLTLPRPSFCVIKVVVFCF